MSQATPALLAGLERRRTSGRSAAPPEPPAAVLRARSIGTRVVVWALVSLGEAVPLEKSGIVDLDRDAPEVSREPTPQRAAACVVIPQVLPDLRELARPSGSCILVVTNDAVRDVLLGAADLLAPAVHVAPTGYWPGIGPAAERATEIVDRMATVASAPAPASSHPHAAPVLVATDASLRSRTTTAGCAWVREDLMCETEAWDAADIVTAELHSIHMALHAHRRTEGRLVIVSDSVSAITFANDARAGNVTADREPIRRVQRKIAALVMTPAVNIRWVRGHAGHPLNEVADRLAVLARRDDDAGIGPAEHARRVAAVIDDLRSGVLDRAA